MTDPSWDTKGRIIAGEHGILRNELDLGADMDHGHPRSWLQDWIEELRRTAVAGEMPMMCVGGNPPAAFIGRDNWCGGHGQGPKNRSVGEERTEILRAPYGP